MKPRLLDLFCGAGGCSMGYHRAGFEVTGVDIAPMPRYPFEFHQADALEYVAAHGHEYDVIHASPPCQAFTPLAAIHKRNHPDLVDATRQALISTGKPYVIENVPQAPLINALMLCGTMFGLRILRHRLFETNPPIYFAPSPCRHWLKAAKLGRPASVNQFITVAGHFSGIPQARQVMECEWMNGKELSQSIPPAYTEYIGRQLLQAVTP